MRVRACPVADVFTADDGDVTLVLLGERLLTLGPVGALILERAARGASVEELTAACVEAFGDPGEGNAEQVVGAAVVELTANGLLETEPVVGGQ